MREPQASACAALVISRNDASQGRPRSCPFRARAGSTIISPMSAPGTETVWTIGKLLEWTASWFNEKHVEGGRLAAELLLARALECRKIELYTRFDQVPTDEQRTAFRELVRQATQHTPIAYLLGHREFFSLEFAVTPAVLIPRPDTEAIVQRALALCRAEPERTWRVLDIGTGSGCIAIAIAKFGKNTQVVASDVSPEAVAVAQANVEKHSLGERVAVMEADLLALPKEATPAEGFDLIVSNPPYIAEAVWRELPPHIRDHEPRLALSPGISGTEIYTRLAAEAAPLLVPGGRVLVEIGHDQSASVQQIFASAGWRFLGSHRDKSDPHERVLEFGR